MISGTTLRRVTVAGLALLVGLAACDTSKILKVNDRDRVTQATLDDPDVLDVVVNGAVGDFTTSYSGNGGDAFLSVTGVMSDELYSAGTFPTRTVTDQRIQYPMAQGNTSDGAYSGLEQARRSLHDAAVRVADANGTSNADYIQLKALEGYALVALAEGFCGAVPVSTVENGEFVYGQPMTTTETLNMAISAFDDALAGGASNLAAVGKGRALLDLGQFAAAATAVAGVPTDYNSFIYHSVSGANNPIYALQGNGRYALSDVEGINGLPFRSANDPRSPWVQDPAGGFDQTIPLYLALKYTAYTDPVVLASGVEARLIEAEAAMQASDFVTMMTRLNDLRADVNNLMDAQVPGYAAGLDCGGAACNTLAPLTDPGDAAGRRAMIFSERGFWLLLTGHRLGDLRRLVYEYGLTQDQAYPTGAYHKGGTYGSDVVFPLGFDEVNNPNFTVDMCSVASAAIN